MSSPKISRARSRRRLGRTRRASASLLLLLGTPGTGKRPVGGYLASERGFVHLDFEETATRDAFLGSTDEALREHLAELASSGRGLVVTWSAGAPTQLHHVRRLRLLGFEPVWFDSDRGSACRAHYEGGPRVPRFRFVDSFDEDGRFRPVSAVVADLVALPPRRRAPVRLRMPRSLAHRPSLRRPSLRGVAGSLVVRVAAGLALAGGTAFATVALLSGVDNDRTAGAPSRLVAAGHLSAKHVAALPQQGVLVTGQSLAGVKLGDTMAEVRALWGGHFSRCGCKPATWLYVYPPPSDPVGAGVQFASGRVVAVFTLGGPAGWHTETGIHVGQVLNNPQNAPDDSRWLTCAGYSAKATRTGRDAVTSILTQGAAVYGFALTRPSVSPCP